MTYGWGLAPQWRGGAVLREQEREEGEGKEKQQGKTAFCGRGLAKRDAMPGSGRCFTAKNV